MLEQVASEAIAMLIVIFLVTIAFMMVYFWYLKGEGKTHTGLTTSLQKTKETFDSKASYTIFHGLYEAMKDTKEDRKDE